MVAIFSGFSFFRYVFASYYLLPCAKRRQHHFLVDFLRSESFRARSGRVIFSSFQKLTSWIFWIPDSVLPDMMSGLF